MVVDARGEFGCGLRLGTGRGAQGTEEKQQKAAGTCELPRPSRDEAAPKTRHLVCEENREAHCKGTVQLVPPVGSALISPCWSMQKPRCPVLPTAWGTAVAS